MATLPTVALIGRQNVGKSTLFNVLLETRKAVVSSLPGTTRDRHHAYVRWQGREWIVVDTGGIEEAPSDALGHAIRVQSERAIQSADVICFVVDGRYGLTREDLTINSILRKSKKPVILAINKLDAPRDRSRIPDEMATLGQPTSVSLSAKNGSGTGDLLDAILHVLPTPPEVRDRDDIGLIFIGKPNVGKSSIVNRIVGEERLLVSDTPHTTRDPQDLWIRAHGRTFRLIDTAGMRRRAKRREQLGKNPVAAIEEASVEKSLSELRRADIAAIVIDCTQPITKQDRHFVQEIERAGVGVLLVLNKWDLVPEKEAETQRIHEQAVRAAFPFLVWAPIVFVSAVTGHRVRTILDVARQIADARATQLTERSLERFMKHVVRKRKPPRANNIATRLLSLTQIGTAPPTFRILVGPRQLLPQAYQRYLINELRSYYRLFGTGIRLRIEQQLRT